MHLKSTFVLATLVLSLLHSAQPAAAAENLVVESPDGAVTLELTGDDDQLRFAVRLDGQVVIETSPLVMHVDGAAITKGALIGRVQRAEIDDTYPWRGTHSTAVNLARTATVDLTHPESGTKYTLEARVFNDGVAFRCVVPGEPDLQRTPGEATEFRVPSGSVVWRHDMGGHYEAVHDRDPIDQIDRGEWAAPPVTFKLPGGRAYASITEAALVNYPGMTLRAAGDCALRTVLGPDQPVSHPFELRYEEDIERLSQPAPIKGDITTPWRVVLVGSDLNTLVNSDIIHNLCPPADPALFPEGINTSWVKPGRAVWRYLDGGDRSLEGMKGFARMAGELGFEYHVIEGFWERWDDDEIRELVDYSRDEGVGLWFWKHSKELRDPEARERFFRQLRDWGVVGAKIDFFDHEHQEVVNHYTDLLEAAARHKILVNFHGANKPTGEPRTWPNELVREGVRGMESSRLRDRARHDATLPFTRLLAGHADYTPTHFGDRRGDTTWTHQIATAAVFTAPLLTYAAHPEALLENPAVEMIKSVPAVWDETRVLPPSEIGDVALFARRTGDTWFLAAVNGPEGRTFDVPLGFLSGGGYSALVVRDHANEPAALETETSRLTRNDKVTVEMRDGGGFIARFEPLPVVTTAERIRSEG